MLRKLFLVLAAAGCLAVPLSLAALTPASAACSGCTFLRADDAHFTQYNGWDIKADTANYPYYMENDNSTWFVLDHCVTAGTGKWCYLQDNAGTNSYANQTDSFQGLADAVVRSGYAANDTREEWLATYLGSSKWVFENRHTGTYLSVDTGAHSGDVIVSPYAFNWSRPAA